jgi:hypothetical protein
MRIVGRLVLPAVVVLLAGTFSVPVSAQAAQRAEGTTGELRATSPIPPPDVMRVGKAANIGSDSGDCDELERNREKLLAQGQSIAACVTYGTGKRIDRSDPRVQDVLPLPQYCYDNAFDGYWYGDREQLCQIRGITVTVKRVPDNVIVGEMLLNEYLFTYGSSTYTTVAQQIELGLYSGWGQINGTTISGIAQCTGACSPVSSDFPLQPVTMTNYPAGEAYFSGTATSPGSSGEFKGVFKYRFFNPNWTGSGGATGEITAEYLRVRCDNAVPGQALPGCIYPDAAGVYTYSLTGLYAELARHIRTAQQSGLPGAYPGTGPNSTPLRRLTGTQTDANRKKACPDSWPRPTGKSCDEYPMASTQQGAVTGGGSGRTFSGCSVTALPTGVTGPTGWSSCMINADHNSLGGSDLDTKLYRDQRFLNGDHFYIYIAP